jgi:predicted enzyme involved in methoxymalonyl-ACP biosynthesis
MLKYVDTKVVFVEVPDEITLAISISGCPCFCEGCHSAYLAKDIGKELQNLIQRNPNDIFMVIHDSEVNTSSGYHAVMAAQGQVISFNSEKIVPCGEYVKNIHNGYIFNVSKIAQDSAKDALRQEFEANIAEAMQNPQKASPIMLATISHHNPNIIPKPLRYEVAQNSSISLPPFDHKYVVEQIKRNSQNS